MVQIEITKQPLYGTVYWDGDKFIYTPRSGFTGNDVYYYTKNENGVITSNKNYVNPTNLAPLATNFSLTADSDAETLININHLAVDSTNPFNYLKIIKVDDPVIGTIKNNETSLIYTPIGKNTIETLDFLISDKQYYSTATLTISVLNARPIVNAENNAFKYRLTKNSNIANTISALTSTWQSSYITLSTYEDSWNSINTDRYVAFSNYIESISGILNNFYNNKNSYDNVYALVSTNSDLWVKDRNVIDVLENNKLKWINTYNYTSSKSGDWNTDYNNFSSLSDTLNINSEKLSSLKITVDNNNTTYWSSNDIYDILENNRNKWDTNYNILSTQNKKSEWNNIISSTNTLSAQLSVDSVDFNNLYNAIVSLSYIWSNQETENVMVSANKWAEVYQKYNDYNNFYTSITANSGLWIKDKNTKDLIHSLISSNSAKWNNLYVYINSNLEKFNASNSLNTTLSTAILKYNSLVNTVTGKSDLWNRISTVYNNNTLLSTNSWSDVYSNKGLYDSMYSILCANSATWYKNTSLLSAVSSNYNKWNTLYNNVTSNLYYWNTFSSLNSVLSTATNSYNSLYNTVTSKINAWNTIYTAYNNTLLSTNSWSDVYTNKGIYDSMYSILCSNSATWYKDITLLNIVSSNYNKWNTLYNNVTSNLYYWNTFSSLNSVLSTATNSYNSLYNTVSTQSQYWDNNAIVSLISSNSAKWNSTFSVVSSLSDSWNNGYTNVVSTSANYNNIISNYNSLVNTVTGKTDLWNKIANVENNTLISANSWNDVYNNKSSYDSMYSILCANSSKWYTSGSSLTGISSLVSTNYIKWNTLYNTIVLNLWNDVGTYYYSLSNAIGSNNILFNNLYNTVTGNSGYWVGYNFVTTKLSGIPYWDSTYNVLVTQNKYSSWNGINVSPLSTSFYNLGNKLNFVNGIIDYNLNTWNNKLGSTILSGNSANWYSNYTTVCAYSGGWVFNEKSQYNSTYNYVTGNSAKFINSSTVVSNNSSYWNANYSNLSLLSTQYLTGNNTMSFSAKDLYVIGNTHIYGNLSALGSRILVDTTIQSTSSFTISNAGSTNAMLVDKTNGGAILNLNRPNSTVLYVKAQTKQVGINLSAFPNTTNALTVSGNISATGYVYPLPDALTLYSSKSAAYETAYTYVTANSAAIDGFILNSKPAYDSMVSYINSGTISSFSAITIPYYDRYNNAVNELYSTKNTQTSSLIALSGGVFGIDNLFASNSSKYEQAYNHTSTATIGQSSNYVISHFFGHNSIVNNQKINMVVQDNIKIKSWALYSDVSASASVDILSSTYSNFGRTPTPPVSLTNNNPLSLIGTNKTTGTNLSSIYIPQGSILQFSLTNNTSVSGLLINLTVQKQ